MKDIIITTEQLEKAMLESKLRVRQILADFKDETGYVPKIRTKFSEDPHSPSCSYDIEITIKIKP